MVMASFVVPCVWFKSVTIIGRISIINYDLEKEPRIWKPLLSSQLSACLKQAYLAFCWKWAEVCLYYAKVRKKLGFKKLDLSKKGWLKLNAKSKSLYKKGH